MLEPLSYANRLIKRAETDNDAYYLTNKQEIEYIFQPKLITNVNAVRFAGPVENLLPQMRLSIKGVRTFAGANIVDLNSLNCVPPEGDNSEIKQEEPAADELVADISSIMQCLIHEPLQVLQAMK
eukprot:10006783-Karenia_brevis.AAC.1